MTTNRRNDDEFDPNSFSDDDGDPVGEKEEDYSSSDDEDDQSDEGNYESSSDDDDDEASYGDEDSLLPEDSDFEDDAYDDDYDYDHPGGDDYRNDRSSPSYKKYDYLLGKDALKQHCLAVVIAIAASIVAHVHFNVPGVAMDEPSLNPAAAPTLYQPQQQKRRGTGAKKETKKTKKRRSPSTEAGTGGKGDISGGGDGSEIEGDSGGEGHHAESYRRTSNLRFCGYNGDNDVLPSPAIVSGGHGDGAGNGDLNLVEFDFSLSLDVIDAVTWHYQADMTHDDSYSTIFSSGAAASDNAGAAASDIIGAVVVDGEGGGVEEGEATNMDREYKCLLDAIERLRHLQRADGREGRSVGGYYVKGKSVAYMLPDVSTYYRTLGDDNDSNGDGSGGKGVALQRRANNKGNDGTIDPASLTFTGFAAKFYNLSPKPLSLYWEGGPRSSDHKLVATVPPYECVGTAVTTPGQSFRFSPTYDKDHALVRWVLTVDEPIVAYDPHKLLNSDQLVSEGGLSHEHMIKYQMQKVNMAYGRDYFIKTGRTWLSAFPRTMPRHYMWGADYLGQVHTVATGESHFKEVPPALTASAGRRGSSSSLSSLWRWGGGGQGKDIAVDINNEDLAQNREEGDLELNLVVSSCAPRVFEIDNFLSPVEIQHLISLASGEADSNNGVRMESSTVHPGGGDGTGSGNYDRSDVKGQRDDGTRSSTNAWIPRETSPIVDAIYRRAADVLKIDESLLRPHREDEADGEVRHDGEGLDEEAATHHSLAESIQLVRYGPGDKYDPHHDFLYPSMTNRYQPSRFATVLLYLNDENNSVGVDDDIGVNDGDGEGRRRNRRRLLKGGETTFPRAITSDRHDGVSVSPKAGKAVVFYNVLPDGNMDDLSQHGGAEVMRGEKWLATLWIWDPVID